MTETELILIAVMLDYDERYPDATPFSRGGYHHNIRDALDELYRLGFVVSS